MRTRTEVRQDIISAYDDNEGVNPPTHRLLADLCNLHGWKDIQDSVQGVSCSDGYRYYLGEIDAETLRSVSVVESAPDGMDFD